MKSTYLFAVIFLTLSSAVKAQLLTNKQIVEHVKQTLRDNYKPDTAKLLRLCKQASVFVKFDVNRQGIISHIVFSNDSTKFVNDALLIALKALQKDAHLIKTLKKLKKPVLQPFVYHYAHGCTIPRLDSATLSKNEATLYAGKVAMAFLRKSSIEQTLISMVSFDGKDEQAIDCLLLKPYYDFFVELPY